jgi:hypothetical protein
MSVKKHTPAFKITGNALIAACIGAMPLVALAQQASSPTTSDPQTGASTTPTKHMHKKKTSNAAMSNSTGGASNAPNSIGAGNGAAGTNSGTATAPQKGTGGGN